MATDDKHSYRDEERRLLWTLLRDATSLAPAKSLLKLRQQPSSASSWDEMWEHRILPALQEGAITDLDLANLLREHEETGGQNVFLYCCRPEVAKRLIAETRLRDQIEAREDVDQALLRLPIVTDRPKQPRLVDVRIENGTAPQALVTKVVETRETRRQVDVRRIDGQEIEIYETERERAVNIFHLHADGLLELRIQSHSAKSYRKDLKRMWELVGDLLPFEEFLACALVSPRHNLWRRRSKMVGKLRFRELHLRNEQGTTMQVKSHLPDSDIADDGGAIRTVDTFIKEGGEFTLVDVYWQEDKKIRALPTRDVHMQVGGEINEYKICGGCTKKDHEYVLDRLGARC